MEELIKHLTRVQTRTLWGDKITDRHYLVEATHGDGLQLVEFQTMDSRPFCYLIRVDSRLDLSKDEYEMFSQQDRDDYGCFSEMIMQMIEDEFDNIDRYEEIESGLFTSDQEKDEGHKPFEYKWPIFSLGAGFSYGVVKNFG